MPASDSLRAQLVQDIAGFTHDPLGHVLYVYPWGVAGTELADKDGPRVWQRATLDRIGQRLRDGTITSFAEVIREATSSGHGIGKSALVAWLVKWALDTREDTKVVVTANTEKQLTTKTWPEVAKWHRLSLTESWFTWTATSLYSTDERHQAVWRADAIPWSEHNTEAFAGLHNEGKRLVIVFDEASKIADRVWEVTEGALTDANTEIIWAVFGNPTRSTGRFRECFRSNRHRWHTQQIDARDVEGTNATLHAEWVADYGEDSDFVKVRVRGMFPSSSVRSLIGEDDVDKAWGRKLRRDQFEFAPVILSCDPAWEGDDMLVIGKRQGLFYEILREIPKNDNDLHIASILSQMEDEYKADAVFVDGGYGTGIISAGRSLGRNWTLVWFSEASSNEGYANKRAEMWVGIRDWLKAGGSLPTDYPQLRDDLIGPETKPRPDGKVQLEAKADMKKRGLPSPNHGDALALTFAHPVKHRTHGIPNNANSQFAQSDYKPHQRLSRK